MSSIVIIGGGHNALVAAFYLAKAGHRPLVLERRDTVGGGAVTEELHPGFRCPTLAHHVGPLWTEIVRVLVTNGRVTGVALAGGEQVEARAVVSAVDPKTTFLRLVDPVDLTPD